MRVTVWSDYCCPWCYLCLDREALLVELGVSLTVLPFELHPETPPEGRPLRPGGRRAAAFAAVGAECRAVGLPFVVPPRSPNTRRALEAAEEVRRRQPEVFQPVRRSFFAAHFVEGRDLGDAAVVDDLLAAAGADADAVRHAVDRGDAAGAVDEARARAVEVGVTGAPALLVGDDLLVPGVQPRESLTRWVERLGARRRS
jgi:predicted DsbA family dithiol-disulfide isomerase